MELAKNVKIKVAVTGVWGLLTLLISLAAGNAGYGGFSFSDFFMTFIGLSLPSCLYWLGFWIWGNGYISRCVGLPFRKDIKSKAFQREGLENERPWRRYFAKIIDIILFSCVVGLVMGFVAPEFSGKLFKNEHVAGILILPFWLPVEALLMTLWGTTLAKWCMGIRVEGPAGGRLPYFSSLKRSCLAYVYGMALGIPLISLFTLIGSYMDIRKGNKTYWDKTCDTTVRYATVRWLPLLLVLGAAGSVFYMGYASERDEKAMILFMAT
ncbi:MAG: RDD family protein [Blastochloris viridis]|uniref:RDD family protein n=1 Tax=Blastochloris viridis TaxID=1079 RepID=A0A6N4QZ92_BLAVI|nr:MAG: RDD family protein [Blastochloris viridis]